MKYCVYGLGAIGGQIAARLAGAGHEVCAVARGETLAAVGRHGLRFRPGPDKPLQTHRIVASDDPAALSPVDCVIVTVKTTALRQITPSLQSMLGPKTLVLSAMNGVPWWFFHGLSDDFEYDTVLRSVDPDAAVLSAIPADRVIGAVVHLSSSVEEPGLVQHSSGRRLIIGAPGGGDTHATAAQNIRDDLTSAGFDVEISSHIQHDVWFKLWGNLSLNPISAITGATTDRVLADPLLKSFVARCMAEAADIGNSLNINIPQSPSDRLILTEKLGVIRPSMLQDAQAGRVIELDCLLRAVLELGEKVGVAAPNIEALLGFSRVFGRTHEIYP